MPASLFFFFPPPSRQIDKPGYLTWHDKTVYQLFELIQSYASLFKTRHWRQVTAPLSREHKRKAVTVPTTQSCINFLNVTESWTSWITLTRQIHNTDISINGDTRVKLEEALPLACCFMADESRHFTSLQPSAIRSGLLARWWSGPPAIGGVCLSAVKGLVQPPAWLIRCCWQSLYSVRSTVGFCELCAPSWLTWVKLFLGNRSDYTHIYAPSPQR